MDIPSLIVGGLLVGVGWFLSGFIKGAGGYVWKRIHNKIDPPPPPPRERNYMIENQFGSWTGEPRKFHKAREEEGYEFVLKNEDRVPAAKKKGWEIMVVDDLELWWKSRHSVPHAFLMRKPENIPGSFHG